jgi:hypothetical protein
MVYNNQKLKYYMIFIVKKQKQFFNLFNLLEF